VSTLWGMHAPRTRRRSIAVVLARGLAVESVAVAAVAASAPAAPPPGSDISASVVASPVTRAAAAAAAVHAAITGTTALAEARAAVPRHIADDGDGLVRPIGLPVATPVPTPDPTATPRPTSKATPRPTAKPTATAPRYAGRNHMWAPAFGIDKPVYAFPCERAEPPGNVVYRWGCAGKNNVYLFGHAANVFKGLHRAYVNKTLKVGQKVYYADANGRVHTYAVTWWKVVLPTVTWPWEALATPTMTLQTCVGANDEFRLIVRLERVGG
jgi:hypothetical protein